MVRHKQMCTSCALASLRSPQLENSTKHRQIEFQQSFIKTDSRNENNSVQTFMLNHFTERVHCDVIVCFDTNKKKHGLSSFEAKRLFVYFVQWSLSVFFSFLTWYFVRPLWSRTILTFLSTNFDTPLEKHIVN